MSNQSNTNRELSSIELDAIAGGSVNWGSVARTIGRINAGVGFAVNGPDLTAVAMMGGCPAVDLLQ
jgi:hypothetical protein